MPSERLYPLRLSAKVLEVVSRGLELLPYWQAAPVIGELNAKVNAESPCLACRHFDSKQGCKAPALDHIPGLDALSAPQRAQEAGACTLFETNHPGGR